MRHSVIRAAVISLLKEGRVGAGVILRAGATVTLAFGATGLDVIADTADPVDFSDVWFFTTDNLAKNSSLFKQSTSGFPGFEDFPYRRLCRKL